MRRVLLIGSLMISAIIMQGQTFNWGNVAMGGGGFVSAVITCPQEKNLIYARTDVGGAYRWEETTKSWIPITDWASEDEQGVLGTEALAIDPQATNKLYILAGISYFNGGKTRILRSSDYGKTFTTVDVTNQFKAHGNGLGRQNGERLAVDPNKSGVLFCGTRWNGLFKSVDDGLTWTSVTKFPFSGTTNDENGICFVLFDKSSATTGNATQTIYVGVSRMGADNLYVTKDGGTTWNPVAGAVNTIMPQRAVLSSDGFLYVTYGNGCGPHGGWGNAAAETMDKGAIYKFNTKTSGTPTNISPIVKNGAGAAITSAFGAIAIDPTNSNHLLATSMNKYLKQTWDWGDHFFESTDGGATWSDLFYENKMELSSGGNPWVVGGSIHWAGSLEFDPFNANRVFVTSGNGIFVTENLNTAKSDWAFCVKGLEETVPLDATSIPGGAFVNVIGDYDGSAYTDTRKSTPIHSPSIGTSTGIAYAGQKTKFVVRLGGDDKGTKFPIWYSEDGGFSWTQFATKTSGTPYKGRVGVTADGGAVLWCAENASTTYRTADKGATWTTASGLSFNTMPVGDQVNPKTVYAYNSNSGALYVSADGGASFSAKGNAGSGGSVIVRAVPNKEGDVWVALYAGGLTRSINSGTSFTKLSNVSYCGSVGFGKAATGKTFPTVYIWGTVNNVRGVYMSTDEGATWTRINDDAHEYGGPANGQFVIGDMNVFGKVYMSTAGRGTVVGTVTGMPICEMPELGAAQTVCNTSTITLDPQTVETGYTYIWKRDGKLLPQTTKTISIHDAGVYSITLQKAGCTDFSDAVTISSSLIPAVNDTVCAGTAANLSVSGTGTYTWYATASSTTALTTGLSYKPTVNANTTYYVADGSALEKTIGQTYNPAALNQWNLGDSWTSGQNTYTLTVLKPITIKSISVKVNNAGTNARIRFVKSGTLVYTAKADNLGLGLQTVPVNYTIDAGTYTVDADGTTGGVQYVANKESNVVWSIANYITLSEDSGWAYGIFFDWVFSIGNTCARTPIDAVVKNCTTTPVTQTIQLTTGWNLISFNVSPTDKTIASVFAGALSSIEEIKTNDGFYRAGQAAPFNGLTAIADGQAYLVKVSSATPVSISVTGMPVGTLSVQLRQGWNLLGYPRQTAGSIATSLSGATSLYNAIKNFDSFWKPSGTTGLLTNFTPGQGYFINLSADGTQNW